MKVEGSVASARLETAGSGDTTIGRIAGPLAAAIAGSGDITVSRGHAENVKIEIAGSGDFDFGGVASNLSISSYGSGSVSIAKNEGSLSISGDRHADITVGGERVSGDDD